MMASMMGSDWKLYTVTIQDVATGARLTLVCDDWVKDDAPQGGAARMATRKPA